MKKSRLFVSIFVLILLSAGAFWIVDKNLGKRTTIFIESRMINVGTIKKLEKKAATFTIRNTGDKDFVIENVDPDCHCTIVSWEKKAVKPNETATVTLEYDNSTTGIFQRTVTVYTNSSEEILILTIRGKVVN